MRLVRPCHSKAVGIISRARSAKKLIENLLLKNNLAYAYEGGTKEKTDWCKRVPANLRN